MFNLASWRNFRAIVISFFVLLPTLVNDMFDGQYDRARRVSQFSPLTCGTKTRFRSNVLTDFYR